MSRYTKYPQGIDQKLPIPPSMKNDIVLTPNHEALHANSMKQPFSLTVDSRDRNMELYPNPNNYVIQTPRYKDVLSVELIGADVPHSGFNIDNSNNVIHMIFTTTQFLQYYNGFRENGSSYIEAVIPPGNYEAGDLASLTPSGSNKNQYGRTLKYQSYYDVNGPQNLSVNTGILAEAMWLACQKYADGLSTDDPEYLSYREIDFACQFDLKSMKYTIMSNAAVAIVTRERDRNVANQPIPNFFINQTSAQAGDSFLGINNDRFQPLNRSAYEVLGFKLQNYFPVSKNLYSYYYTIYYPGLPNYSNPVYVNKITSLPSSIINLIAGKTQDIIITLFSTTSFRPTNSNVICTANGVATVKILYPPTEFNNYKSTFTVTGVTAGSATITITAADGSGISTTVPVTVAGTATITSTTIAIPPVTTTLPVTLINTSSPPVLVNSITSYPTELFLYLGVSPPNIPPQLSQLELAITVLPTNATDQSVTYSSSDNNIATVDNIGNVGLVSAHNVGACVITISANDGSGITTNVQVTVLESYYDNPFINEYFSLIDGAFDRSNPVYIQVAEGENYYYPPLYPISQGAGGQYTNNYNPADPCDVSLTGLSDTVNILSRSRPPNFRYTGGQLCCYSLPNRPNLNGEKYIILDIPELNYRDLTSVKNNQFYCRILFDTPINITTLATYYNSGIFPAVTNLASTNTVKSIKGADIGNNRCIKYFTPTQGVLAKLTVRWLKYDGTPYDFQGQDHAFHLEILTVKQTGTYFS